MVLSSYLKDEYLVLTGKIISTKKAAQDSITIQIVVCTCFEGPRQAASSLPLHTGRVAYPPMIYSRSVSNMSALDVTTAYFEL